MTTLIKQKTMVLKREEMFEYRSIYQERTEKRTTYPHSVLKLTEGDVIIQRAWEGESMEDR